MSEVITRPSACTTCGAASQIADRFCSSCGSSLPARDAVPDQPATPLALERRRLGGTPWQLESEEAELSEIDWSANADLALRMKRRRARRIRMLNVFVPFTVAVAIVLGGLAGRAVSETGSTIDRLHQVSTPPAQITDQTVRSEANAGIPNILNGSDGSDRSAPAVVSGAEDGQLMDGDASTASASGDAQETSPPGDSNDSLTPALSGLADPASPDPLPDPPLSDQRSDDQSVPHEPPFNGEALAEQLMAEGKTFDTSPAIAALEAASKSEPATAPGSSQSSPAQNDSGTAGAPQPGSTSGATGDPDGEGGGVFDSVRDRGGDLKEAAEGAAMAAGIAEPDSTVLTIMIMGVDAREGSAIDIGVRPDALMVLRLDPEAGTCKGLAIPRDSLVELPGYGKTKINHALMLGGIPYQQLVVENYLGISIDHYALIDFTGFAEVVDSVGGITIAVPPELASPAVSAGTMTIDGEQALQHARYRGGPDGDFGRIERQQQIMRGLIEAAGGRDLLSEAERLLSALSDHVRTDMEIDQLVSLTKHYQDRCSVEGLTMQQIPGEVVYGPIIDPLFNLPLSYVVSEPDVIRELVDELFAT